jgi:hypothetical protein
MSYLLTCSKLWGIQKLSSMEKLGDYIFKIEFGSEEEKAHVLEGGPWRHKGDAEKPSG